MSMISVALAMSIGACRSSPGRPAHGDAETISSSVTAVVRVTFREVPLPGARISWFRAEGVEGGAPAVSGVTDANGMSEAPIRPGRYFLVAEWRKDGDFGRPIAPGDRFAWFGGNPVYLVLGRQREIFLGVEEFPGPSGSPALSPGGGGVAGLVLSDGVPLADVHVFAYLRAQGGFRDMGFAASAPTDGKGGFILDLPPGKYYIVARKRAGGGVAGPLRKGDHFGYYAANPVEAPTGGFARVVIPVTLLKLRNAPSYSGEYAASAFVEGRIVGREGKPRKGVYAALYDNPDLLNRPVFLSDVTGDDGRYRLPVPVPGTYYLGARSGYGGSPVPGDLYGRYEGNPEHAVDVKDGDRITGADIVVDEVR